MLCTVHLVIDFWAGTAIHAQFEYGPRVSVPSLLSDNP